MDTSKVILGLSALAQDTRLQVFRLLMKEGADGLPATEIADRLGVRQNLMSTHLSILASAGLTTFRRDGRRMLHAVDIETTRSLLSFLVEDCCNGHPEACASLLDAAIGNQPRVSINR